MIPESEISESLEYEVKSKIGNIFVNEKMLEEYSVKTYEIDPYFYQHYKKKLMKMDVNTYYSELMFIFLNIFQLQKLMKILRRKDKKRQKKNLVVNLLELIQVSVLMKIMKLVEYKHLLVSLKIAN